ATLEREVVHPPVFDERAQGIGQDHVALGDELVAKAAVPCVQIDVLVRDHRSRSFVLNTTRRRCFSSFDLSTSRGTFSTTFQGRTSLPRVPHRRREASWILLSECMSLSKALRTLRGTS